MDVNVLRSMVLKFARKKADEAPPPVMKIGINPNLLFKSDTFGLIDMQAPLSKPFFHMEQCLPHRVRLKNTSSLIAMYMMFLQQTKHF